jgi:hypothetical protein
MLINCDPGHEGADGRPLTFAEFVLRDIRSSNGECRSGTSSGGGAAVRTEILKPNFRCPTGPT